MSYSILRNGLEKCWRTTQREEREKSALLTCREGSTQDGDEKAEPMSPIFSPANDSSSAVR